MSQLSSVVLTDNSATDHTFSREGMVGKAVRYVSRHSTGAPALDSVFWAEYKRNSAGAYTPKVTIVIPVTETDADTGRTTRVDTNFIEIRGRMGTLGSQAERLDLITMAIDALNDAEIRKLFVELVNVID